MLKKVNKSIVGLVLGVLVLLIGLRLFYFDNYKEDYKSLKKELPVHFNGLQFAGSESCIPCHKSIYQSHLTTAHFNTSAWASDTSIMGSFGNEKDRVRLTGSYIALTKKNDSYQQGVVGVDNDNVRAESKIDIVIGSGVKGQSHLSFKGNSLYQLQASYFTLTDDWINSPGFPNYSFQRPVMDSCLKCHVTFAKNRNPEGNSNEYIRNSIIFGIDCERCHGPLQAHVEYRSGKKKSPHSDHAIRIDTLERQAKLDLCIQCHSGLRANQMNKNPFSYVIGDKLDDYAKNFYTGKPNSELDVHGNQYGLLQSSQCFQNSEAMTCTTCHEPHRNQRGETQYFIGKCMECHQQPDKLHSTVSNDYYENRNCIQCHMPLFPSETMKVKLEDESSERSVKIRTHLIGIYIDSLLKK